MPSSGKIKTKRHLFSYLVISGSVPPNVSVAPNRNKLPHYVHVSGTGCNHLLALYWLMVFIHETHVMPCSGKVITKRHLFSYLVISGSVLPNVSDAPNRNKLPHYLLWSGTGCTHLGELYWLMVFIHKTHVTPFSGKVKTKRHLFSYLVHAGSECCPMCQSLQTGTNYHIMYFWLVQVAVYWLMVIIHETHVMLSSGKVKTKSHLFLQVVSAAQCVSCSKQEQIKTLRTF